MLFFTNINENLRHSRDAMRPSRRK